MSKKRWSSIVREVVTLAAVVLVALAARSSLADHYVVPSGSMEYTLLPGDRVFVDKMAYGLRVPFSDWNLTGGERPARGEIVIFDSPEDGTRLIKRIVAVGGDRVTLRRGRLSIDGSELADPAHPDVERIGSRLARLNLSLGGGRDLTDLEIPAGHVLVVGDFRGNSSDGRYFGVIDQAAIYARAKAVYWRSGEAFVWQPL